MCVQYAIRRERMYESSEKNGIIELYVLSIGTAALLKAEVP